MLKTVKFLSNTAYNKPVKYSDSNKSFDEKTYTLFLTEYTRLSVTML